MHFIEQLFGFSPDAGSGLAEAIVHGGLAAFCVASSIFLRSRSSHNARSSGQHGFELDHCPQLPAHESAE